MSNLIKVITLLLIIVLVIIISLLVVKPSSLRASININSVDTYLNLLVGKSKVPGIQYIVVNSDEVLFQFAGGFANISDSIKMENNTKMMAYSMTKTITAIATLQLVEREILDLDDPIDKYLENNPYGKKVTIRHLLAQMSGIPNPIPLKWIHDAQKLDEFDENDELEKVLLNNPKLSLEPGKKYAYSNISYWLLGKIIENVTDQTYAQYILENITEPLNILQEDLTFTITNQDRQAKGYLYKYSAYNLIKNWLINEEAYGEYEGNWLHINDSLVNGPAFGGLIGNAASFGIILQDLLKDNSILINEETKKLLYQQQKNNQGEHIPMSLGWHIGDLNGIQYFFKEGGGGGFHSEMRIYPEKGIASVVMLNRTSYDTNELLNKLDQVFLKSF